MLHRLRAGAHNGILVAKSSLEEFPDAIYQDISNHDLRDRLPLLLTRSGHDSIFRAPRVSTPSSILKKPPLKKPVRESEKESARLESEIGYDQLFVGLGNFAIQRSGISPGSRRWARRLP